MEIKALEELRERVKDCNKPPNWDHEEDTYLKRWLTARNWNVDKAEAMLRKSLIYRADHGLDSILETYQPPEVLTKYFIGGVTGFDEEGCPVWLDPFTKLDCRGVLHSVTKESLRKFKLYTCEQLLAQCQEQTAKLGHPVGQIVIIFDMDGLGWKHLWKPGIDVLIEIVQIFEDNYPELLKQTYVINAPKLFVLAYNMVKHVISARTAAKTHILGKQWLDVITKSVDISQIPEHYGGTQRDPDGDPMCKSKILYGGPVPKTYYFTQEDIHSDMTCISVSRASTQSIKHDISVDSCTIKYSLRTEKNDLSYGIFYRHHDNTETDYRKLEEVLPLERKNTEILQSGEIKVHQAGTYILVLDNSFSWTRSKKVFYSIEIVQSSTRSSFSSALDMDEQDENINDLL